jgi:hypothetical protein
MDNRPFCGNGCRDRMRCAKNEVAIRYGHEDRPARLGDSVLVGDLWRCPKCGSEIVIGWAERPWDPNLYPGDHDFIFKIAQAIDESPGGYVALDAVRRQR